MNTPPISPTSHLALPFFGPEHQALARDIAAWAPLQQVDESDDRRACKQWTRLLGDAGWLRYCVPAAFGGALDQLDSLALVILRETLVVHSPLADFSFALAGLGRVPAWDCRPVAPFSSWLQEWTLPSACGRDRSFWRARGAFRHRWALPSDSRQAGSTWCDIRLA